MAEGEKQLDELLGQDYVVTSVHQESTGAFHIRMFYRGEDAEEKERYRSITTRDEAVAKRAADMMLDTETTF